MPDRQAESNNPLVNKDINVPRYQQVFTTLPVDLQHRLRGEFFSQDLGLEFCAADFEKNTLLSVLEEKDISLSGIDHRVGATLAKTRLATLLNIDVGEPLVCIRMVMLDQVHKPVQKVAAWFRADR
jgi:DNA-binding GntR family transcriptional regulator